MKHHHFCTSASGPMAVVKLAIGIAITGSVHAQSNANRGETLNPPNAVSIGTSPDITSGAEIRVVPNRWAERGIGELLDQEVRGINGQRIGSVEDFMIDPRSGMVVSAVVSSDLGGGAVNTLRMVPIATLKQDSSGETFTTNVEAANWSKLPSISAQDLKRGLLNVTENQSRVTASTSQDPTPADYSQRFMRASTLPGKLIQTGGRDIGEVEDVIIDFNSGTATAVVATDSAFTGSDHSYLVPTTLLQAGANPHDAFTTHLTRADFSRAVQASGNIGPAAADANNRRATRTDEPVTPTGRATETRSSVDPMLLSAARSVRQIWDAHPELAKLNLQVTAENGRLVFQGTVPNVELWERAKDTAEGVISRIDIQNRISIQPK